MFLCFTRHLLIVFASEDYSKTLHCVIPFVFSQDSQFMEAERVAKHPKTMTKNRGSKHMLCANIDPLLETLTTW